MNEEEARSLREIVKVICFRSRFAEEEEVAQEVTKRFLTNKNPIWSFRAWVSSCAINVIRDMRKAVRRFQVHAPRLYRPCAAAENPPRSAEIAGAVQSMLELLTPDQRQAVEKWLAKKDGAKVGNMPGKERARLHRAFAAIRKLFPEAASLIA